MILRPFCLIPCTTAAPSRWTNQRKPHPTQRHGRLGGIWPPPAIISVRWASRSHEGRLVAWYMLGGNQSPSPNAWVHVMRQTKVQLWSVILQSNPMFREGLGSSCLMYILYTIFSFIFILYFGTIVSEVWRIDQLSRRSNPTFTNEFDRLYVYIFGKKSDGNQGKNPRKHVQTHYISNLNKYK